MKPRVLVIENDSAAPLDLVEQWLTESGLIVDVIRPHAGDLLPSALPAQYQGLIALGGRMGAHDDEQFGWLTTERSVLKDVIAQDLPFVGICLGGQLLATAVDGKSVRTPDPEAGVVQVQVTDKAVDDLLFGPLAGQTVPATGWHQDYIIDLPEDAVIIGSTPQCPVHAFRIGKNVYGLQFHPEASTDTVKTWVEPSSDVLQKLNKSGESIVSEAINYQDQLIQTWQPVFHRWAELVKRSTDYFPDSKIQANY